MGDLSNSINLSTLGASANNGAGTGPHAMVIWALGAGELNEQAGRSTGQRRQVGYEK